MAKYCGHRRDNNKPDDKKIKVFIANPFGHRHTYSESWKYFSKVDAETDS